jgi:hypothetical protein
MEASLLNPMQHFQRLPHPTCEATLVTWEASRQKPFLIERYERPTQLVGRIVGQ